MGKKRKGRDLHRGPFTASDFKRAIKLDGWEPAKPGDHLNYRHRTRRGKIQIDEKWNSVKPGHSPFRGIMEQGGYTKLELLKLLNGIPLV